MCFPYYDVTFISNKISTPHLQLHENENKYETLCEIKKKKFDETSMLQMKCYVGLISYCYKEDTAYAPPEVSLYPPFPGRP